MLYRVSVDVLGCPFITGICRAALGMRSLHSACLEGMRKQERAPASPGFRSWEWCGPMTRCLACWGRRSGSHLSSPLWADAAPGLKVQRCTVHWPVPHLLGKGRRTGLRLPCASLMGRSRAHISPCDVVTFATDSHLGRKISTGNAVSVTLSLLSCLFPTPGLSQLPA